MVVGADPAGGDAPRRVTWTARPLARAGPSTPSRGRGRAAWSCSERDVEVSADARASMPCTAAASCCTVVMIGLSIARGRRADRVAVGPRRRAGPHGRVDDHVDLAVEDQSTIERRPRRRASAVLAHHLGLDRRCGAARLPCPRSRAIAKPRSTSRLTGKIMARLSRLATDTKTVPWCGSPPIAAELRLGERRAEVGVDAHDLAGRAHLRPEQRCRRPAPSVVRNRLNGSTASLTDDRCVHRQPAAVAVRRAARPRRAARRSSRRA